MPGVRPPPQALTGRSPARASGRGCHPPGMAKPRWDPAHPEVALDPRVFDKGDGDWTPAPADSHVHSFRLTLPEELARGPGGRLMGGKAPATVEVRFRKAGRGKRPAHYAYSFSDHADARAVFDALRDADHPGEVVDARLRKAGVPYAKLG